MTNQTDNNVINTNGLSKSFRNIHALQSLNMRVAKNTIFGFLGPNGAGKSTTIKLLLGLARPSSGHATVFGLDSVKDSTEIRKRVGYLAQDPRYYENLTARQTLRFTARFFYKGSKAAIEERIEETLELVGLSDKADRPIKGFSGGERQRLGIAQAQINYPDLLILDEPAASLDPMGRHDVLEVMARLRKHTTIFYSTHILSDVQKVSDHVAILNRGKLVMQSSIQDLLESSGNLTYSMLTRGDISKTYQLVSTQSWVSSLNTSVTNTGLVEWQINVSDERVAERQLLQTFVTDTELVVIEFGRKKQNLEEVFMNIVERDQDAR